MTRPDEKEMEEFKKRIESIIKLEKALKIELIKELIKQLKKALKIKALREGFCLKCGYYMTQLCRVETRIISGRLINLPGEPMGCKCEKCGYKIKISYKEDDISYEEDISNSLDNKGG